MQIEWFKCKGGVWCNIFKLDLTHELIRGVDGIFLIWTGSDKQRKILMVGTGKIDIELEKLRNDLSLQAFQHLGVFVSWTEVPAFRRNAIETFLLTELKPSMNTPREGGGGTKVNMPWDPIYYEEEDEDE